MEAPVHVPTRHDVGVGLSAKAFARHLLEMCVAMCGGAVVLSFAFFGGASILGAGDLVR